MTYRNIEDEALRPRRLLPLTIAVSVLLHGLAYASLRPMRAQPAPRHQKTQLRFEVSHKPEAPPSEPVPPPPPAPPKPRAAKAREVTAPPPASPEVETPAPSTGVTLAGDGNNVGFAMPLGSGGDLEPARPRPPTPVNQPAPQPPAPRPAPPQVVPVADLSTRPMAPSLVSALERNYPADARRRGSSGNAKVRARIDPDGVVRQVTLLSESGAGFGDACSRSLSGSRWGAPKDKAGRPVATEIRYTCRFVVDP